MTINEKLLQFVDYLGLSQRKFTKLCGLSEGALRGSRAVGTESIVKIKETMIYVHIVESITDAQVDLLDDIISGD